MIFKHFVVLSACVVSLALGSVLELKNEKIPVKIPRIEETAVKEVSLNIFLLLYLKAIVLEYSKSVR